MWIFFREKSKVMALLWTILMMVLGFFTACVYLLMVLYKSKGDWHYVFFGEKEEG